MVIDVSQMPSTITEHLVTKLAKEGILRARDAERAGIARTYLQLAVESGKIERIGRGLYAIPGKVIGEHQSLIEVSKRVPHGVICLLSALRVHNLTTQNPHEVWICIENKARKPSVDLQKLRVIRSSEALFSEGIMEKRFGALSIRLTNPARTVIDCFRFRNKIGIEVAVEALRECLRQRSANMDAIWRYAKLFRVATVMRPYIEAMTT